MPCVGELWHSTGCPLLPELLSFSLFCALFCAAPPALQKPGCVAVRGGGSGCVSVAASGRSPSCPGGSAELGNCSAGNSGLAAGNCSDVPGAAAAAAALCPEDPAGPRRAGAARRVRAAGALCRGSAPRRAAPRAHRPQPRLPLRHPADRGAAQGRLLPGRGDLPPRHQKPSAVEMSEMFERSKQNVAHGLAWSFYVGYLKIVLPRLKKSMEEFSRANPNLPACRKTWKLHILVPLSCDIYDDLEKADSNIQYVTELTETTLARAGIKKRVYKHSLYAITDEENQLWHCAVEYATPLQTLYAMSQDECAAFSREERLEQAKLFYRTLEEILKGSKECADTYRLIAYEEPEEAETHFLSREIVWHLRQEHHEEIAMLEGSHPPSPSTALDSAELNLQISVSDLPQPLRTDGF
ncbi:stimulator of interferon genes protein isoform X1 [Haemorhous mexicanus]|uniref:stimulator of interferon genes protein isoform X1 n=1 Tax=Haemorhous mexicanus TaxID=30427 RepID=UPI0028BE320E|nr:stimulator of interferon genes protein isoform X1 [Haemorhous mexicanus]